MATEEVIIDVQIDGAQSLQELGAKAASLKKGITELRNENKLLKEQVKEGTKTEEEAAIAYAANAKVMKEFQAQMKATNGAITAMTHDNDFLGDSLHEMRANLSQLKNEYASLNKVQRESAQGQELRENLLNLNNEVKEVEASFGDMQRNVGNYPKTVTAVVPGFDKMTDLLGKMGTSLDDIQTKGIRAFKGMGTAALNFGKVMITPPVGIIVAILSAILLVVTKVSDAFKKNDAATTALQKAFATFTPILEALNKIFEALANIVAKVITLFTDAVGAVLSLIPGYEEAAEAAQKLVQAQDDLEETERNYVENSAKRNSETAKLRAMAREDDKYTYEERKALLSRGLKNEQANLKDELEIAKEKLRIIEEVAKQEADTSDETADKISQARAAMYNANEKYFTGTRRLIAEMKALEDQETKRLEDEAKKAEDRAKKAADAAKKIRENLYNFQKEIETKTLELLKDGLDKAVQQREFSGQQEIEALKKQTLTTKAEREKRAELIKLIERQTEEDIKKINEQYSEERLRETWELEHEKMQLMLNAATQGTVEYYELRRTAALRVAEEERRIAQKSGEDRGLLQEEINKELENIAISHSQTMDAIDQEEKLKIYERQKQALLNNYALRVEALEGQEVELAELELEQARLEAENLVALDAETKALLFENQEAYEAAVIASNQKVKDSSMSVIKQQQKLLESQANLFYTMGDAVSTMFGELAEDNQAFAVFQKTLALAQASVELGLAIASAVAAATPGDPYSVAARIAAAVAGVVASFVAVVASINSAKIPTPPKFAQGGVVPGRLYSGDKVTAKLNSGEMVLTREQQARLFQIANERNSIGMIDYSAFAESMAEVIADMPAPVMDYSEFTEFQRNKTSYTEFTQL